MSVDSANKVNNQSLLEDLRDLLETLDTFFALERRSLLAMGEDDPRRARMVAFIEKMEELRATIAWRALRLRPVTHLIN